MLELTFSNGNISYNEIKYPYETVEKIDDMCVHIYMGGQIIAFLANEITINGTVMTDADQIISTLNNN